MSTIPVQVAVACSHCNARYRLKEAQLKIMKEMKCLKCGKKFILVPQPLPPPEATPVPNAVPAPAVEPAKPAEAVTLAAPSAPSAPAPENPPAVADATVRRPLAVSPLGSPADKSSNIVFKCAKCAREVSLPKAYAGKKIRCKQCSEIILVPAMSPAPDASAPLPAPLPPPEPTSLSGAPVSSEIPISPAVATPVTPPPAPPITPPAPPVVPVAAIPVPPSVPPVSPPSALAANPSLPMDGQAELQALKDRSRELERRSAELEAEIIALKKATPPIESHRAELTRYYETEFAAVENRLKNLAVGRAELLRYFDGEQALAEAQVRDLRERQKALKN